MADKGIGISKERQRDIFAPFTQADSSMTRKFGGTGLGPTISRHLFEMFGGRIWLESEVGKGSRFTSRLRFAHRIPRQSGLSWIPAFESLMPNVAPVVHSFEMDF